MPFLTRNENQSQVRYAAPASPITPTTGDAASATTPAPTAVAAASVPLRLATALLRWTSELTPAGCTMGCALSNRGRVDTATAVVQTRRAAIARACGWPCGSMVNRDHMAIRVPQRGALLLGMAGALVVIAGGFAGSYYVVATRAEAR